MRRTFIIFAFIALGISLLIVSGCGPKQRAKEGLLDTPESHYNQGMRKFESDNIDEAEAQFSDAISLNAKYAPAYAGLSLVNAAKGAEIADAKSKERRQYFDNAKKMLEKAKDLDDKNINVWIAQIRTAMIMKQDENWIENCQKALEKALKINPKSDEAYYFMGLAYKQAYDFKQSEDMLRQAIDIDGAWSEKAGNALKTVHKIVEAQPGTKYGKIIALEEKINRADLAVLFIEELNVVERIQRRDASTQAPDLSFKAENPLEFPQMQPSGQVEILDISGHWAESMIRDFVQTGLFDVMQDHKFYPNMPVTRIEFAGAVQRLIYMVTRDPSIFSKYIGEKESHIRDMRTDHPYYGAAMLTVERDIMDLDKINGYFYPDQNVSGPDALLIIRDIKNALKW
mgnify:CR=1 FL=1